MTTPTGEQPAVITEKSRFSWPVLLVLAGVALWAARADSTAAAAEKSAGSAQEQLEAAKKADVELRLRVQRVEDAQVHYVEQQGEVKATLKRLEEKLDKLRDERRAR